MLYEALLIDLRMGAIYGTTTHGSMTGIAGDIQFDRNAVGSERRACIRTVVSDDLVRILIHAEYLRTARLS